MTTTPDFVAALVMLAKAAENLSGRAQWTVEAAAARADVFVVVDNPVLAARLKDVLAEHRVVVARPTEHFVRGRPA